MLSCFRSKSAVTTPAVTTQRAAATASPSSSTAAANLTAAASNQPIYHYDKKLAKKQKNNLDRILNSLSTHNNLRDSIYDISSLTLAASMQLLNGLAQKRKNNPSLVVDAGFINALDKHIEKKLALKLAKAANTFSGRIGAFLAKVVPYICIAAGAGAGVAAVVVPIETIAVPEREAAADAINHDISGNLYKYESDYAGIAAKMHTFEEIQFDNGLHMVKDGAGHVTYSGQAALEQVRVMPYVFGAPIGAALGVALGGAAGIGIENAHKKALAERQAKINEKAQEILTPEGFGLYQEAKGLINEFKAISV